ncbi:RNA recognition motif domain protein [Kalmanozyma brasiliensis GHG001]|uniref:RRM domain-containing protein n=1 Tax=Kalmanozyma brasiliensis (strain GHG001) TaxID=1365824 RepID=V5EVU1_KALBG|nr:RNA recognition motif domain protein [Kalmanozyma brasiliensis GHG001]EST06389.1 RNA recognition motif domain protein [Kalmanozyma brasiliensis GHG001]
MDRLDQPLSSAPSGPRRSGAGSRNSPYNRSSRSSAADSAGSWQHDRYQDNDGQRRGPRNGSSRSPMFFPQDKSEVNEVKPTGKLTIENLHYDVSERELKDLFGSIGPVAKAYIKYDRSDRSTGVAVVIYDNPNHALQAKNEFDGAKAKGQVISITQEMRAERPKGVQAGQRSLLSRFDLSSRMKGDGAETNGANSFADRLGPVRNGGRGDQRQPNGRQVAQPRNAPAKREKRKPVTAADLDAELEAFMNTPSVKPTAANGASVSTMQATQTASIGQDVEMS